MNIDRFCIVLFCFIYFFMVGVIFSFFIRRCQKLMYIGHLTSSFASHPVFTVLAIVGSVTVLYHWPLVMLKMMMMVKCVPFSVKFSFGLAVSVCALLGNLQNSMERKEQISKIRFFFRCCNLLIALNRI